MVSFIYPTGRLRSCITLCRGLCVQCTHACVCVFFSFPPIQVMLFGPEGRAGFCSNFKCEALCHGWSWGAGELVQLEWMAEAEVQACGGVAGWVRGGAESHRLWPGCVSRLRHWLPCHTAAGYGVAVALAPVFLLCPPCCETCSLLWLPAPVAGSHGEEPGWPTFVCPYPISQLWQLCVWTETQKCVCVHVCFRVCD